MKPARPKIKKQLFLAVVCFLPFSLFSQSLLAPKNESSFSSEGEIHLFFEDFNFRKDTLNNPEGKLVFLEEQRVKAVPALRLEYKQGFSSAWVADVAGLLISGREPEGYIREFYYRDNLQGINRTIGKFIHPLGTSYFDNPADLIKENQESIDFSRKLNRDFKTGNLTMKVQYRFDLFNFEFTIADYRHDTFFDEKREDAQAVLKIGTDFWEKSADLSLSLRSTSNQEQAIALSFSAEVNDSVIGYFQSAAERVVGLVVAKKIDAPLPPGQPPIYVFREKDPEVYSSHVFGFQTKFPNTDINWILEYFYSGTGYSEDEFKEIKKGVEAAESIPIEVLSAENNPYGGFLKQNLKRIELRNYRQNYLKTRWTFDNSFQITETAIVAIYNLDDGSIFSEFSAEKSWNSYAVKLSAAFSEGEELSEYESYPRQIFSLSFNADF